MRNKKAQLEDLLPLLVTIIFLFGFWVLFILTNANKTIAEREDIGLVAIETDANQLLINFLRTPFPLENIQDSNMADAINKYFLTEDEDLFNQIDAKAKEFFSASNLETDYSFWSLKIKYPGKDDKIIESDSAGGHFGWEEISIILPINMFNEPIEINLFIYYISFIV